MIDCPDDKFFSDPRKLFNPDRVYNGNLIRSGTTGVRNVYVKLLEVNRPIDVLKKRI